MWYHMVPLGGNGLKKTRHLVLVKIDYDSVCNISIINDEKDFIFE